MKSFTLVLSFLLLAAGCASPTTPTTGPSATVGKPQQTPVAGSDFVVPPPNAQWTIACTAFNGYGHVERAKAAKEHLIASTGLTSFYVVHEDDTSTLYYGFYRYISERDATERTDNNPSRSDLAEGDRAQQDLAKIKSLTAANGDPIFTEAVMSPLEPADPPAPAEWDLKNLDRNKSASDPTRAFWSLEIAVYKDNPQRKQAAVDSVRDLRAHGVTNAYFYHGKTASSVCIGAWPEDAIKEQDMATAQSVDPDTRLLVLPQPLPKGASDQIKDSEGHPLRTLEPKLEPIDPTMIDTMHRYPNRSVNGYDIKHTYNLKAGGTVDMYDQSLLILIPREAEKSVLDRSAPADATPSLLGGTPDQGGHLRSLP
jgi:hypothetical protein